MNHYHLILSAFLLSATVCADGAPPAAPAAGRTAAVVITADATAKPIPGGFIGFSYEKSAMGAPIFDKSNTALVALFKDLGPGVLRIAGANVEKCRWNPVGPGGVKTEVSPHDVERLMGFLNACDWKVIYGIGLAENTHERAAAEAAEASRILKNRLVGYEIGNEPNLYDRGHRPKPYGYKQFLPEWTGFADAIAKAVPGAVFTGPSTSTYGRKGMALPMARDAKDRLAMLTSHYYITGGKGNPEATIERMLTFPDKHLEEVLDTMREAARVNGLRLGFCLDEVNSFHSSGKKDVSDTYASALWAAETLFTCAERGADGVYFHVAGYSPYTPILHDWKKTGIMEIRPEFYGIRYFAIAANGTPMRATVTADAQKNALRAHAVRGKDGAIRIGLINTDSATACVASIDIESDIRQAECIALTGPALEAKQGVLLARSPISTDGSWRPENATRLTPSGRTLKVSVPPASALMVKAQP